MLVTLHNLRLFPICIHIFNLKHTPSFVAYEHAFAPIHLVHFQHIVHHDQHSNWHVVFHSLHVTHSQAP
jgi:hypothetical protein